jgi:hypothetical protein
MSDETQSATAPTPPEIPADPPARKLTLEEWRQIEDDCTHPDHPLSFADAEKKYGVSQKTIAKRATRKQWPVPRLIAKTIEGKLEAAVARVASKWAEKGERHREVVFTLAHESLKKMKPKPPKNFREAEAADKMARRAAGLEVADVSQQTLIQINEAIDAHVTPVEEGDVPVQDAEVVTDSPELPLAAQPA